MSSDGDVEISTPPRKRIRTVESQVTTSSSKTRLYAPFRALGHVTNHIPFAVQTRSFKGAADGPRLHILTCLGRSWAMWEGGKMTLLFVGTDAPDPISCLIFDGDAVWASAGPHILKYIRGKEVTRITNPLGGNISSISIFGDSLLVLTDDGTRLLIFSHVDGELNGTIEFDADFTATIMLHPATYINKILIGSAQGALQLWNIRSLSCIHKFDATRLRDSVDPKTPCAILSLVQSPAIDVVGIGFSSGELSIYDIRADERLMRIFMDGGSVQALSFRSDGKGVLASASASGHIALWDLNEGGRLLHIIRGAHDSAVSSIEWIPGQPLLISSGGDNSVKQWVFESATAAPRLLKFRSGHHQPPHLIRYYGEDGKQILTASRDRSLRYTSVVRDSRSFELSQGPIAKKATSLSIPLTSLKLPPMTSISFSSARSKDWDDVLTSHAQETFARTWSVRDKKIGKWNLNIESGKEKKQKKKQLPGSVRCVCVTACGNFGLAGSSTGVVNMWNMQSGILRKTFQIGHRPAEVAKYRKISDADTERAISGIATDSLNRLVIVSTFDGTVNFFDFHTKELQHTLVVAANISSILLHRDNGLLAVVCDDLTVRIIDIELRKVVRELSGFRGRILDVTFSPDSRWLITTSLDSLIRTFDIPTGRLIDVFRTPSVATSVTFSPTNDFLATAHVDSVGIYLWANRSQYADVTFQGVVETNDDIAEIAMPSMQDEVEEEALEALSALKVDEPADPFTTPTQLDGELITLTLLPRARWEYLLHLDAVQERNKPKEPPKAPEKAPFFLPTLPGVEHRFAATSPQKEEPKSSKTNKRLEKGATKAESTFYKKLMSEDPEGDYEFLFAYTKTLTPAAIDLELRSLVTLESLNVFLNALSCRLKTRRDFEAVQSFLNVFLRLHGEVLVENVELKETMEKLRETQKEESERLLELIASGLGTLGFVRDIY